MTIFEDHAFDITTIDTYFERPKLAASHLIIEGRRAAFIDTGTAFSVPNLLNTLASKNIPIENVDYVIVTHVHLDHAGGAGQLLQILPNARLVVHPRGARHLIDPTKLKAGAIAVYGETVFQKNYGDIIPINPDRVIEADDEFTLTLNGSRTLTFLDTPGHAKHHFCVFDEKSRSFFTGDTFGISYRDFDTNKGIFIYATTTPVQFEPTAYHNSINRLLSYHPEKMYLTHYGEVTGVDKLADKLHDSVDELVTIMESVADISEQRHNRLTDAIMDYFLKELRLLDCRIPEAKCRELLALDAELNAQGLEVWWDKG